MLTIDPTITSAQAPFALKQGNTPNVTIAVRNASTVQAAAYTVTGTLTANGRAVMALSQSNGTMSPGQSANVTLRGSQIGNSAMVGATSLDLAITLTDTTNGIQEIYTLAGAFTVQQGTALNITSVALGAQ